LPTFAYGLTRPADDEVSQELPARGANMPAQARKRQSKLRVLKKRVAEFGQRLAISSLDHIEETVVEGLKGIVKCVDTDRICWYELDDESADLLHTYTAACLLRVPMSPKRIPPTKMPFLAERLSRHHVVALHDPKDLPPLGHKDRQFLEELGVKSLLLIPSGYSPRRKGVLGLSSYSVKRRWPEEVISQLVMVANILGATLERKYAQAAIQESEERFRYLFSQASIGIALESIEGRILEVNPAFCSMLGYSPEEVTSGTCERLSHPEDEKVEQALFQELRQHLRSSYSLQKRFFRKNGSEMWGQVNVSLLDRNGGSVPLVIGMVSDITEQKAAEAAIYQRDKELQRLAGHLMEAQEEERRRISRELHDDIGQRVSLLACELDLKAREKGSKHENKNVALHPEVREELNAIATDIHKLSHELHSASLQSGGIKVALKDVCAKYASSYHLEVDLRTEGVASNLPPDVALCLFRVAQEALANVVKHSRTKKVLVKLSQDSERVRLTVRDSGVGFDPSVKTQGLGLTSMRERLRFCGGLLSVKSVPNRGTEVVAEVATEKVLAAAATA
jgi:PAS domain S-box-containing protein